MEALGAEVREPGRVDFVVEKLRRGIESAKVDGLICQEEMEARVTRS